MPTLDFARDFIDSVGIPAFAVLVGIFTWSVFTIISNTIYFIFSADGHNDEPS